MRISRSGHLGQGGQSHPCHPQVVQDPPGCDSDNRTRGQLSEISPALNWLIPGKRKGKNLGPDATS